MRTTLYTLLIVAMAMIWTRDAKAQDCPILTPLCLDLNTSFMPDACMVEVWASDFLSKINDGSLPLDSFFISFHPTDTVLNKIFISEDGNEQFVTIYISDGCSTISCDVTLSINDNTGVCPGECPIDVSPWCGYAVVTCSAFIDNDYVASIIDTRKNSQAPRGDNWTIPSDPNIDPVSFVRPNTWTLSSIGQVFGMALNPNDGSIFFAATDIYALDFKQYAEEIDPAFLRGLTPPTCPGPAGSAGIYKTSFDDQSVQNLVTTSTSYLTAVQAIGGTRIPNSGNDVECAITSIENRDPIGNGIGNIAYDTRSNHLYATNLEDGKIYSINANTGVIDFVFDPFAQYATHASTGMVRVEDRIWAIQVMGCGVNKKVFFSRASTDPDSINRDKQIYSVLIGGDGNFIGSEQLELTVTYGRQAKITDIAFSTDCTRMLVTERGHPHKAQVHEYVWDGTTWSQAQQFFVGIYAPDDPSQPDGNILGTSSSGGVSYGAQEENCVVDASCDGTVWVNINCGAPDSLGQRCAIYGSEGIDATGNQLETNSSTDIYISFTDSIDNPLDFKTNIGDIEIYNCCCIDQPARDTVSSAMITGLVTTAFEMRLAETEVSVQNGSRETMVKSQSNGIFTYTEAQLNEDYMIQPEKSGNVRDGLTTLDLIQIQRHILGLRKLNSPYKMIAADINKSGSITTMDLVELRKVLIGVQDEFKNNRVWNFAAVNENVSLENPFEYNSYVEVKGLPSPRYHADFIAIKTGDVNGDNTVDIGSSVRSTSSKVLKAEMYQNKGVTEVHIYSSEKQSLYGLQFSIQSDAHLLEFKSGQLDIADGNMNTTTGETLISWNSNQAKEINDIEPLMTLVYRDPHAIVEIGKQLSPEWYDSELNTSTLTLEKEILDSYEGITISPNPSSESAVLKFYAPLQEGVEIIITSVDGRMLFKQNYTATKGMNQIRINRDDFANETSGVAIIQVISPEYSMMTRMLLIK